MDTPLQELRDLVALTESYLFQNYALKDRVVSTPSTTQFYRDYARNLRKNTLPPHPIPPPANKTSIPPPPSIQTPPVPAPSLPKKEEKPRQEEKLPPPEVVEVSAPVQNKTLPAIENSFVGIRSFQLREAEATPLPDFTSTQGFVAAHTPHLRLKSPPPSDATAQQLARQWKQATPPLEVILIGDETAPLSHQQFLKNIVAALESKEKKGTVVMLQKVNKLQKWPALFSMPSLRLVIAPADIFTYVPALKDQWCPVTEHRGKWNGISTLLIEIEKEMSDPSRKKILWQAMRDILKV